MTYEAIMLALKSLLSQVAKGVSYLVAYLVGKQSEQLLEAQKKLALNRELDEVEINLGRLTEEQKQAILEKLRSEFP